jgi:transcriptional regulator with GAF, ATPase, and Fis domain
MFELVWLSGGAERRVELAPGRGYRIGRDPSCEIAVEDPFVSAEHAEARLVGTDLQVRRTKGRNPLVVNGKFLDEVLLKPGESLSVGQTVFTFGSSGKAAVAAPDLPPRTRLLDTMSVLGVEEKTTAPAAGPAPTAAEARGTSVQLLGNLSDLLSQASDNESLAKAILALSCRRLNATRALLARVAGPEHLDIFAAHGFPADAHLAKLISTTVLKRIVEQRQAVLIGDTAAPGSGVGPAESIQGNRIRAVACTPILDREARIIALLYVDNQERAADFSDSEGEFLIWIGQLYRLLADNLELRRRLEAEVVQLKAAGTGAKMVAESPAMLGLLDRARKAAATAASILIFGETGTGKECRARFIHQQSPCAKGPFVAINCAAIPETLFESEMYGHRKGAFTGATADHKGAFQEASGGTLFLDEIGDLDYGMQTKLLRAIQERTVRTVGAVRDTPVDARFICATNKDLQDAMRRREFREDLYFRIGTLRLKLPPLRERREDIVPLARHFVRQLSDGARRLSRAAEKHLSQYPWPGNVRELRSCILQAVVFAAGSEVQADELALGRGGEEVDLASDVLEEVEKRHILNVLR